MSGFATPMAATPVSAQKSMSSRLANMKFMQRGSISTPSSEHTAKRVKTDYGSAPASSTPGTPTNEQRIQTPVSAQSTYLPDGLIETQWTTQVIHTNGYRRSDSMSEDEVEDSFAEPSGRQTFGDFKKRKKTTTTDTTPNKRTKGASHSLRPLSDDEAESSEDEGEISSEDDSSEDDSHAGSRAQARKRKAASMDYSNQKTLAELDKVDLSKSSYTKSKGTMGRGSGTYNGSTTSMGQNKPGKKQHKKNRDKNKVKKGKKT